MQKVLGAVQHNPAHTVQAGHKGVAARGMGADLLALVKGKQRDAHRIILGQRLADHLAFLVRDFILQRQHFGLRNILHLDVHSITSRCIQCLSSGPVLLIRCNRFPPDNALIISVPRRKVCCQNHKVKTFLAPMQKHSVVFYEKNTKCIVRDRLQTGAAGLILKPTGGVIHESIRNTHLH